MTKNDVLKLFDLLEQLYHGHRRPRDDTTLSIWSTVLKPWNYTEVRDAVIKRARTNRHFPDPSELAALLPAQEPSSPYEVIDVYKYRNEKWEKRREWRHAQYRAAGIPNAIEAKRQGIPYKVWCEMVDKAFPDGVPEPEEFEKEQTHGEF